MGIQMHLNKFNQSSTVGINRYTYRNLFTRMAILSKLVFKFQFRLVYVYIKVLECNDKFP